jgi:hypothetical protein
VWSPRKPPASGTSLSRELGDRKSGSESSGAPAPALTRALHGCCTRIVLGRTRTCAPLINAFDVGVAAE